MLYAKLSHYWVSCGGTGNNNIYLELPILLVIFFTLYTPTLGKYKNTLLALTSVYALYILYDIFYHFLAKSPRPGDLSNITVLSDFSLPMSFGLFIMTLLILLPLLYVTYHLYRHSQKRTFYTLSALKLFVIAGLVYYINTPYFTNKFNYLVWSQARTIKKNGRIASFIYYGMMSKRAKKKLAAYQKAPIDVDTLLFNNTEIKQKRNIYIVVLESFIDPRLIQDATFSRSPLAKALKPFLINEQFSLIKSPVYGGGTAQPEFEILTGVKALARVDSIEFNVLQGRQISGFVHALKKNGYSTHATIATYSGYYNSKDAYKSIGFDTIRFLEESSDFSRREGDRKIFDGDLYDDNIAALKRKTFHRPYLNYVLGMYGHFPYDRNLKLRPDVITVTHKDPRVRRITNQFYYRTKALAKYINQILALDPTAIIFVSSDHIPPIISKDIKYVKSQFENIALLLVGGKTIDINHYHQYDIPRIIWKRLTDDQSALQAIDDKTYETIYFKTLSKGLR